MTQSVLERIAAGDETAVKACIDQFSGLVWSLARRFSDSAADAEDASQEIFLEIWKSAARYNAGLGSEAVFITTIARRRLIDRLRSRKRKPATEEFDETTMSDAGDGGATDPVPTVMSSEVEAAQTALAALPADQREVLLLGIVEGMTHSEIATRTGKPLGTVKTQMRRGLDKVRRMLATTEAGTDG